MATDLNALVLTASHVVSFVFSGSICYFSYRAFRRSGSLSMRSLTVGFGIITSGLLFGGGLDWLTGLDFKTSVTIQSLFTTIGLAFLMYALFVEPTRS